MSRSSQCHAQCIHFTLTKLICIDKTFQQVLPIALVSALAGAVLGAVLLRKQRAPPRAEVVTVRFMPRDDLVGRLEALVRANR